MEYLGEQAVKNIKKPVRVYRVRMPAEEAIGWINKAMPLNPICPVGYLWMLGHAYFLIERYAEAIATLGKAVDQ